MLMPEVNQFIRPNNKLIGEQKRKKALLPHERREEAKGMSLRT